MDRRTFLCGLTLGSLASPLAAEAQSAGKVPLIGYVGNSSPSLEPRLLGAFRDGLRNLGYVEGQNIRIEYRWAEGRYERFPDFMAELVRLRVEVIVVAGTPATLAARRATNAIPIVMAVIGDALETGVVPSLARPGGNVTGLSTVVPELEGKRLELLKQALPKLSRLAVLANPANPFVAVAWRQTQRAAETLHIKLQRVDVRQPEEFGNAFSVIANERSPGADYRFWYEEPAAGDVPVLGIRGRGWAHGLWPELCRHVPAIGHVCGQDSQRCEAGRLASRATHQVRADDQPQDGEDARPDHSADAAPARGPGDRVAHAGP